MKWFLIHILKLNPDWIPVYLHELKLFLIISILLWGLITFIIFLFYEISILNYFKLLFSLLLSSIIFYFVYAVFDNKS